MTTTNKSFKYENKIVLLIDAENIHPSAVMSVFSQLLPLGNIIIRKAYADWSEKTINVLREEWLETCFEYNIRQEMRVSSSKRKNSTDMAIAIDAMRIMRDIQPDAFAIVSSDSDFSQLAMDLRFEGVEVYLFGSALVTKNYRKSGTRFFYLTENNGLVQQPAPAFLRGTKPSLPPRKENISGSSNVTTTKTVAANVYNTPSESIPTNAKIIEPGIWFSPSQFWFGRINPEKNGLIVGANGLTIQEIQTRFELDGSACSINNDGTIRIVSNDKQKAINALKYIKAMAEEVQLHATYPGIVESINQERGFSIVKIPASGGVTGLLHINDVSSKHPGTDISDYVQIGQDVQVQVIAIEAQNNIKFSLLNAATITKKARSETTENTDKSNIEIGKTYAGIVVRLNTGNNWANNFALVKLPQQNNLIGSLHISRIYGIEPGKELVSDYLSEGQEIQVRVESRTQSGKPAFSMPSSCDQEKNGNAVEIGKIYSGIVLSVDANYNRVLINVPETGGRPGIITLGTIPPDIKPGKAIKVEACASNDDRPAFLLLPQDTQKDNITKTKELVNTNKPISKPDDSPKKVIEEAPPKQIQSEVITDEQPSIVTGIEVISDYSCEKPEASESVQVISEEPPVIYIDKTVSTPIDKHESGQMYTGTVISINNERGFAIIKIPEMGDVTGLLHIRNIAVSKGKNTIGDYVAIQQTVEVRVIESKNNRLSLSMPRVENQIDQIEAVETPPHAIAIKHTMPIEDGIPESSSNIISGETIEITTPEIIQPVIIKEEGIKEAVVPANFNIDSIAVETLSPILDEADSIDMEKQQKSDHSSRIAQDDAASIALGKIYTGTVTHIKNGSNGFALVKIQAEGGVTGRLYLIDLPPEEGKHDVADYVQEQQVIQVKVMALGNIRFSLVSLMKSPAIEKPATLPPPLPPLIATNSPFEVEGASNSKYVF